MDTMEPTTTQTSVEKADTATAHEVVHFTPEEREAAILRYTPFAKTMARNYWLNTGKKAGLDDYRSEAILGLCIAASKYDKNNPEGAQFLTYAFSWIRQKLGKYSFKERSGGLLGVMLAIRRSGQDTAPRIYHESQNSGSGTNENDGFFGKRATCQPQTHQVDDLDTYQLLIKYVPAEYRQILWDHIVVGKCRVQIAREIGVTRERVKQRLNYCYDRIVDSLPPEYRELLTDGDIAYYACPQRSGNGRRIRQVKQRRTGVRL